MKEGRLSEGSGRCPENPQGTFAACAPCKGAKFSGWKSHLVKVSTAPPIASLESVMVTVLIKRRQQGDRVGRR